jgi:serine/threonine protein kinase
LNARRGVELVIQLADALAEADNAGFVHGDIWPGTIVVTSKDRSKLMNFGFSAFTNSGAVRRTAHPLYVAPEEATAQSGDIRSDIFSLGAVLFEMLTGRQRGQGRVPSSFSKNIPPELDRIVGKMLASNVAARYQSPATVAGELRSMATILERRATEEEAAFERRGRRGSGRSGVVVAACVLVLVALTVWMWRAF